MALESGDSAPAFALVNVDETIVSINDFAGSKALVVIFTCNHCPYVVAWEDRIIQTQKDYTAKRVQFVLINPNDSQMYPQDSFEAMQRHAKAKDYPFPYLRDESQEIAIAYGATRTPHVFVFDADQHLVYSGAIDDCYSEPKSVKQPYLRDALDAVLARRAPEIEETSSLGCSIKWRV